MPRSKKPEDDDSRLMKQLSVPSEVRLRLMPVQDALDKLDRYLNDAMVAGLTRVRVIHGKGTGTMKQAVQDYLAKHPLVAKHYPAPPHEGGGGVTIAELE